jgi:hypothetical protein
MPHLAPVAHRHCPAKLQRPSTPPDGQRSVSAYYSMDGGSQFPSNLCGLHYTSLKPD